MTVKNIQELFHEVKTIQSSFTALCDDLKEWEEAQQADNVLQLEELLGKANCRPIAHHALEKVQDMLAQEAYLTLLLAVAEKDSAVQTKEHPVLYPCRIAAGLPQKEDMKAYFQKSHMLDENTLYQYVQVLQSNQLAEVFLVDALILTAMYDKGNQGKLDFIAELAALWSVSLEKLEELLLIVQTSLQKESIFCHDFRELSASAFYKYIPYLKTCTVVSVVFPESFYCTTFGKMVELTPGLEHTLSKQWTLIKKKKKVLLKNVRFIRKETQEEAKIFAKLDTDGFNRLAGVFSFLDIEKLSIVNCQFSHFLRPLFTASWIKKIEITQSSFTDFHGRVFRIDESTDSLTISQSTFSKCLLDLKACDYSERGNYPNSCIGDVKGLRTFKSTKCQFDSCYLTMIGFDSRNLSIPRWIIKIPIYLFSQGYFERGSSRDWYTMYNDRESCQFQDEGSQCNNSELIFP